MCKAPFIKRKGALVDMHNWHPTVMHCLRAHSAPHKVPSSPKKALASVRRNPGPPFMAALPAALLLIDHPGAELDSGNGAAVNEPAGHRQDGVLAARQAAAAAAGGGGAGCPGCWREPGRLPFRCTSCSLVQERPAGAAALPLFSPGLAPPRPCPARAWRFTGA